MRGKPISKSSPSVPSNTPLKAPTTSVPATSAVVPDHESRESSPLTSISQGSTSSAAVSASHSFSGSGSSAPSSLAPVTPPDGHDTNGRSGLDARLRSRLGVERNAHSSRSPKRSFGDSDLEPEGDRDGSVDGRRVRRKPVSNMSNLSSASPNALPPPSSPDDPLIPDADAEEVDDDDDEDMSVLKLLADPTVDGYSSDSSLSPPPPDPKEVQAARRKFLHPNSQISIATTPLSSAPPSSRPSPAPFEGSSQETTTTLDNESQSTITTAASARLTRRQRRNMGLPKHGNASGRITPVSGNTNVIVIPGGRHPTRLAMKAAQERQRLGGAGGEAEVYEDEDEGFQHEWEKNGNGRKDSRGFVILNI